MLVEKEIIAPGCYWYVDEATGAPRKLDVSSELTKYWHEQGSAMLGAGLTVPVPFEHDFSAHPMTPKDKLLNNSGWIKEYRRKDAPDGRKDVLFGVLDIQDEDIARKLPRTIRWTSPWINSFTDGHGKHWNNVISHLALTTRPRITKQAPFGSVAAALSMAQITPPSVLPQGGYCLSRAGRLVARGSVVEPMYPIAFSMFSGAFATDEKEDSGWDNYRPKKPQEFTHHAASHTSSKRAFGTSVSALYADGKPNQKSYDALKSAQNAVESSKIGDHVAAENHHNKMSVAHHNLANSTGKENHAALHREAAKAHEEAANIHHDVAVDKGIIMSVSLATEEKEEPTGTIHKEAHEATKVAVASSKKLEDVPLTVRSQGGVHRELIANTIHKSEDATKASSLGNHLAAEEAHNSVALAHDHVVDATKKWKSQGPRGWYDKHKKAAAAHREAAAIHHDVAVDKGIIMSVALAADSDDKKKKKKPPEDDSGGLPPDEVAGGAPPPGGPPGAPGGEVPPGSPPIGGPPGAPGADPLGAPPGGMAPPSAAPGDVAGLMNPLLDSGGDVQMEELLCDLLSALGVQMPDNVPEPMFKRALYEAAMSKIKDLSAQGLAAGQQNAAAAGPNTTSPAGQAGKPNPLIQQEQQPMYMSTTLSLDDIKKIADPTMQAIMLSMHNDNVRMCAEVEASTRTANNLRDAELKKAAALRAQRVALLGKVSPRAKADLDAMLAQPNMALSMGDGGTVNDPMAPTIALLEKGLADIPRLLTTPSAALSEQPQPTDGEMSAEQTDALAENMARMMGCPPDRKAS